MTGTTQNRTTDQNRAEGHPTLEPDQARSATKGNGIWIILMASTALAIAALLVIFGGAFG